MARNDFVNVGVLCMRADCDAAAFCHGMCRRHYAQWYREKRANRCAVDGCTRAAWARGWCNAHYMHWRTYGTVERLTTPRAAFFCSRCRRQKTPVDFWPHSGHARGHQYWCKACMFEARKERARRPESPRARRKYKLREYGITPMDYDALFAAQSGQCAICGVEKQPWSAGGIAGRRNYLAIDHDHVTGRIRGLLCGGCNFAIGHMRDNPALLRSAAEYLERFMLAEDSHSTSG